MRLAASLVSLVVSVGCARGARPVTASPVYRVPPAVDIARARSRGARVLVRWSDWSRETFARARAEGRFILLDGAAEWCHWCHVMDATTYSDPEVARLIDARFVAVRVDVDARPDLATRYAAWGWPATVVLSPEGEELAKFRGYIPPERMREILTRPESLTPPESEPESAPAPPPLAREEALASLGPWIAHTMDDYYDTARGSWGDWQKLSVGVNVEFELRRAAHGDASARTRATETLRQQRAIYDPVWGGVYQYSAGPTWNDPHFEKLMTYQAPTLEAAARAAALTHDDTFLRDARSIAAYMTRFLRNAQGAFLATQDADVNAHDPSAPFVDGHVYYALDDVHRRALGLPRVDPHVYARENGLAIASLATLDEVARDPDALDAARRAADLLATTHVTTDGAVHHEAHADAATVRHLLDAASLGWGYARLAEVLATSDPARARYVAQAERIARRMLVDFRDPAAGALFGQTEDPAAIGVFARRERPVEANVTAARFLMALHRLTGEVAWRAAAVGVLDATLTLPAITSRGRFLGDALLALDDTGLFPWEHDGRTPATYTGERETVTLSETNGETPALTLDVRPASGFHVNTQYPTALSLDAQGTRVPLSLRRSDARQLDPDRVTFIVPLSERGVRHRIRGVLRYALCGPEDCIPRERWFSVTAR